MLNQKHSQTSTRTQPYLQVWVSFHYGATQLPASKITSLMSKLANLCHEANERFSKTVHSISVHLVSGIAKKYALVRFEFVLKILKQQTVIIEPYGTPKLGIMLSTPECHFETSTLLNANYVKSLKKIGNLIELVFVDAISTGGLLDSIGATSNIKEAVQWISNEEKQCKEGLEKLWKKDHLQFAILTGWPDTNRNYEVNFTNLVSFWDHLIDHSRQSGSRYIMHRAFDTPYSSNIFDESRGWWRLKENPVYASPLDYIFEDKQMR